MMRHALLAVLVLAACSTSTETDGEAPSPRSASLHRTGACSSRAVRAGPGVHRAGRTDRRAGPRRARLGAAGRRPGGARVHAWNRAAGRLRVPWRGRDRRGPPRQTPARRPRRRRGHPRLPERHRGHLGHHPGVSGRASGGPADQPARTSYCIDPARIYISGFSAGAVFTLYLGCNVPQTFAGIAVVAGSDARFDTRCCTKPVSGIFIHGARDEAFSLQEGRAARGGVASRDQLLRDHHGRRSALLRLRLSVSLGRGRLRVGRGPRHSGLGGVGDRPVLLARAVAALRPRAPRPDGHPPVATRSERAGRPAPAPGVSACTPGRRRPSSRPRSCRPRARRPSPPAPPRARTGPACTRPRPSARRWAGPRPFPGAPGGAAPDARRSPGCRRRAPRRAACCRFATNGDTPSATGRYAASSRVKRTSSSTSASVSSGSPTIE